MVYLSLGVVYVLMYAAAGWALRAHPMLLSMLGHVALLTPPIAGCVVILRRRRHWAGCQRLFWDLFGIGLALWTIGHLGWAFEQMTLRRQSWLQWHTLFSLCGGIFPLIAFVARPHAGPRRDAVGPVGLIVASYGLLAAFIYSYFVLVPAMVPGQVDVQGTLLKLVQANRALLFAGAVWGMIASRRTPWFRPYAILAAGVGVGSLLRVVTSLAIMRGEYRTGTLYDLAWIVPFLSYAWAALEAPPSQRAPEESDYAPSTLHTVVAVLPVFLVPLIGYGVLYWRGGGPGDDFLTLLTGLMTVAGLGILTLRLAAQGGELQRMDARKRLLAAATEQAGDLILITRVDGGVEMANDAFVRAVGYSRQELSALGFGDLIERGFGALLAHISGEVRDRGVWRGTLLRRRRDGSSFPAACTVAALRNASGTITHFVGAERDITQEIKLRDQLVHSERLSAIGELVAGVAHEINNPLQTIIGSVELLLEEAPLPDSRRDLEVVRREAGRAGQIVRNLLSFVRRSTPDRVSADLNSVIQSVVELRGYHLQQRSIRLVTELPAAGPPVLVNREEIQQVILNLVLNAEQAMTAAAQGTTITIRCESTGDTATVDVADDGPGVSAEMRGRIFEPFFTTKDVGQGTGLGLSISHGIAAAHNGSLTLCSSPHGACFRLSLPLHAQVEKAAVPDGRGHSRRVLIVDDEAPIRRLLARLLERRGFEVDEAESAETALTLAGKSPLALVLCDVHMPGVAGKELYRALVDRHPELAGAFVFITGDRTAIELDETLSEVPILAKPFTGADLEAVLASLGLDRVMA